jgi:hypothetical protein
MENKESKLSIVYQIKGIGPYDRFKGWVSILLVPLDPLDMPKEKKRNIVVSPMGGPMGGPIPEEIQEVFGQIFGGGFNMRQRQEEDREIFLIEKDDDFQKRNWKYGDQICVTFEKMEIKDLELKD